MRYESCRSSQGVLMLSSSNHGELGAAKDPVLIGYHNPGSPTALRQVWFRKVCTFLLRDPGSYDPNGRGLVYLQRSFGRSRRQPMQHVAILPLSMRTGFNAAGNVIVRSLYTLSQHRPTSYGNMPSSGIRMGCYDFFKTAFHATSPTIDTNSLAVKLAAGMVSFCRFFLRYQLILDS